MKKSYGYLGEPKPFTTRAEVVQWVGDKRNAGKLHEQDQMFQEFIVARMNLTEDHVVGVAAASGSLERAMAGPAVPDYQDPHNEIGSDTSVYRDMEEARQDQSSPLYKSSAFFRAKVAAKIGRSTGPVSQSTYETYAAEPTGDERDTLSNYHEQEGN